MSTFLLMSVVNPHRYLREVDCSTLIGFLKSTSKTGTSSGYKTKMESLTALSASLPAYFVLCPQLVLALQNGFLQWPQT
jgi:hypothetical protein